MTMVRLDITYYSYQFLCYLLLLCGTDRRDGQGIGLPRTCSGETYTQRAYGSPLVLYACRAYPFAGPSLLRLYYSPAVLYGYLPRSLRHCFRTYLRRRLGDHAVSSARMPYQHWYIWRLRLYVRAAPLPTLIQSGFLHAAWRRWRLPATGLRRAATHCLMLTVFLILLLPATRFSLLPFRFRLPPPCVVTARPGFRQTCLMPQRRAKTHLLPSSFSTDCVTFYLF